MVNVVKFSYMTILSEISENPKDIELLYGKEILNASFKGNVISLHFKGLVVNISDDLRYCCEIRHISCDDDLSCLVGKKLLSVDVKEVSAKHEDGVSSEIAFLEIKTDKTVVSFCTHNEHNGYYSGFNIKFSIKSIAEIAIYE